MFARSELAQDLRRLGVEAGDTIMVHASLRAIGEVAGGPDEVHLALKEVLTASGTLMMYASCPQYADEIGRGNLTPAQEEELLAKLPPYDPQRARSARDNGALVELLRTYGDAVVVNDHVARFVVWGRHAAAIAAPHPWNYPFGAGTPLERFLHLGGKVLLLGSDLDAVTFLHYSEHVVDVPGKRIARFKVPVREHGRRVWRHTEEFDTADAAHPAWPDRFFEQIVRRCLEQTANAGGLVGRAQSYLIPAAVLHEVGTGLMIAAVASAPAD